MSKSESITTKRPATFQFLDSVSVKYVPRLQWRFKIQAQASPDYICNMHTSKSGHMQVLTIFSIKIAFLKIY